MEPENDIMDELNTKKDFFLSRVMQELKRAQRYLSFVSYINIDASRFNKASEIDSTSANIEIYRKLRMFLHSSLRQTDIISGFHDGKINILLIETHKEGAGIVRNRLQESIKYFLHEMFNSPMNWRVEIHHGSFPDDENTPNIFYERIESSF